jgi:hypothetical protein
MYETGLLGIFQTGSFSGIRVPDWDELLAEADVHLVTPLLAQMAINSSPGTVPSYVITCLEKEFRQTMLRNLLIAAEIENLAAKLTTAGVRCMILKGIRLAERLYGHIGARYSNDIDLLIEEDALNLVLSIMKNEGYSYCMDEGLACNTKHSLMYDIKLEKTTSFGKSLIELHFHFTISRLGSDINMQEIWQRAIPIPFGKTTIYDLSAIDLIMYLCFHSASHRFETLRQVLDVAAAVKMEGPAVDWPEFVRVVKSYNLSNRVYASLAYAAKLLKAPVPGFVLDELRPPGYLINRLERECPPDELPTGLSYLTFGILRNETIKKFLANIFKLTVPSKDKLRVLYNLGYSDSIWLYYPRHWRDLLQKIFFSRRGV